MKCETIEVMGVPFLNTTKEELLNNYLYRDLSENKKRFVVTANPEIVLSTRENPSYKKSVLQADYIIPDGIGVVMASRWKKNPLKERIPGFEIMIELIKYAEDNALSCYFLGAKYEVNNLFLEKIKQLYPNLIISGYHHGFIDINDQNIVNQIRNTNPDLIFVALGMPKQEQWIEQHIDKFHKGLFMGVGGSFDVIAGIVKRAPSIWMKLNLEWLYRLIQQPKRWKRTLKVFEFMIRIIFERT